MSTEQKYMRFQVAQRIEHFVLVLSFTTLAVTGLIQKFSLSAFCQGIIALLGGIEITRIIHRTAAIIFLVETLYHLVELGYKLYVLRQSASMIPELKDVTDALQALFHNLGLRKDAPKMKRYNFAEKAEYWAMMWGGVMMGLTGYMMWKPIQTASILPGVFIPAAKAVHGWEAVLAVLAIIVWHFYNVHIKSWNWSMIKGHMSQKQMEEEHAQELEDIQAGDVYIAPTSQDRKKRILVFVPVTVLVVALGLAGIGWLAFSPRSAITTIPQQVSTPQNVYSPQTPTPESASTATTVVASGVTVPTTWDGGIKDMFAARCSACHGTLGGLSVATYADLMKAGVITVGNSAGSKLIVVQSGQHPGLFLPEELAAIKTWIDAGAPEK